MFIFVFLFLFFNGINVLLFFLFFDFIYMYDYFICEVIFEKWFLLVCKVIKESEKFEILFEVKMVVIDVGYGGYDLGCFGVYL